MSAPNTDQYRVRPFTPDDVQAYKALRLEALGTEPGVFSASLAKEQAFSDAEWIQRVSNPNGACFGLYHSDKLIGITGIIISKENPQAAFLTQSFICPEERGKGLSALLYEARIAWAVARGLSTLVVGHRKDNRVSRSANQRFGFTYTYEEVCTWGDGTSDTLLWYRLELT